jgi:hypothetical protein
VAIHACGALWQLFPAIAVRNSFQSAAPQLDTSRRTLRYSLAEVAALLVTTFLQVR